MKSARIYTNDLNRLIAATKSFVSDSDHRPCNQYIKLEFRAADNQVVAMAVDGYRMSVEHSIISDCTVCNHLLDRRWERGCDNVSRFFSAPTRRT